MGQCPFITLNRKLKPQYVMGNQTGKIVYWDGSVKELEEEVTVAELMLVHPQQVVLDLNSAVKEKRPTPLAADEKLEIKKTYLMVPLKPGKHLRLTTQDTQRILFTLHSKYYFVSSSGFLPWLARFFHHTHGEVAVVDKTEDREGFDFSEFMQGRPQYLSTQLSGKVWKPSLDTIKENKVKTKLSRWLFFLKSFSSANT